MVIHESTGSTPDHNECVCILLLSLFSFESEAKFEVHFLFYYSCRRMKKVKKVNRRGTIPLVVQQTFILEFVSDAPVTAVLEDPSISSTFTRSTTEIQTL